MRDVLPALKASRERADKPCDVESMMHVHLVHVEHAPGSEPGRSMRHGHLHRGIVQKEVETESVEQQHDISSEVYSESSRD